MSLAHAFPRTSVRVDREETILSVLFYPEHPGPIVDLSVEYHREVPRSRGSPSPVIQSVSAGDLVLSRVGRIPSMFTLSRKGLSTD